MYNGLIANRSDGRLYLLLPGRHGDVFASTAPVEQTVHLPGAIAAK